MSDPGPDASAFGDLITTTVRVATWNLWWMFGPWQERAPRIERVLADIDADVVCLQEVWVDLSTGESSASRLAEALGYHVAVANAAELEGVGFANAVLSRWPIRSSAWEALPSPAEFEEHRVVLRADVDGPRGPMQVFTTHLHWRMDHSHIRQEQVRAIGAFVAGSPDRTFPAVLCGDFNAEPDSDEVRMLVGKVRDGVAGPGVLRRVGDGDGRSGHRRAGARQLHGRTAIPGRRATSNPVDASTTSSGWPKAGGAGAPREARLFGTEPVAGVWRAITSGLLVELRY
ncbi:MAG: endonuclease/exonuclease/phosphatase family protein [Acidimicrobiales bacterium]